MYIVYISTTYIGIINISTTYLQLNNVMKYTTFCFMSFATFVAENMIISELKPVVQHFNETLGGWNVIQHNKNKVLVCCHTYNVLVCCHTACPGC